MVILIMGWETFSEENLEIINLHGESIQLHILYKPHLTFC